MFKRWFKERLKASRVPSVGGDGGLLSKDLENVYLLYGICAQHCSNIEYGMAMMLHPMKWTKYSSVIQAQLQKITEARAVVENFDEMKKYDALLEKVTKEIDGLNNHAIGKLISQIKVHYPLKKQHLGYFKEILDKRNNFVHSFWGEHGRRLRNPDEATKILEELHVLEKFFRSASNWVWEQARRLNGIPMGLLAE